MARLLPSIQPPLLSNLHLKKSDPPCISMALCPLELEAWLAFHWHSSFCLGFGWGDPSSWGFGLGACSRWVRGSDPHAGLPLQNHLQRPYSSRQRNMGQTVMEGDIVMLFTCTPPV